jgi:hypothetical protein
MFTPKLQPAIVERSVHHERNRHDIFTWAWFSEPHGYAFNGHLVRHKEANLCIDSVPLSDESLADIAPMGVGRGRERCWHRSE